VGSKALDASGNEGGQAPASRGKLSPGPGLPAREVAASQLARIHEATTGIVAQHGYQALKVRDVVSYAEVSTRAFYEHFGSKEDCFLQTHDLITRRATRRIIAAQAGECDWRKRARLVLDEFVRQLESEPNSARLVLIEAYAADDASLAQAWRAERILEGMLAEAFARTPKGMTVPSLIVEGMVAGIASVSRKQLLSGKARSLRSSSDELVDWALRYVDPVVTELTSLDRQTVWRDTKLDPLLRPSLNGDIDPWSSTGDRALILAAVTDLATEHGYARLTAPRICSAAGVSRRKFDAHFDDVEGCYLATLEQRAGEAIAQAARAQAAASNQAGGVYRAVTALCDYIASDAFLARVCLTNDFPPGPEGARSRERLLAAISELLGPDAEPADELTPVVMEASTGAIWSLFHHYLIRDWSLRRQISATLSYLAVVPIVGAPAAVAAIRGEQAAP
jgi:AcrR family transcriptional regulator